MEQFSSWHISSQFCAITLQSVTARLIESSKRLSFVREDKLPDPPVAAACILSYYRKSSRIFKTAEEKTRTIQGETVPRLFENEQSSILITLFLIFSANPVPGPPRSIKAVVSGPGSVVVSWLPPDRPNGLLVQVFINFFILMGIQMTADLYES